MRWVASINASEDRKNRKLQTVLPGRQGSLELCQADTASAPWRVWSLWAGKLRFQPGRNAQEGKKRLAQVSHCTAFVTHVKDFLRWLHEDEEELTVWSKTGRVVGLLSGCAHL